MIQIKTLNKAWINLVAVCILGACSPQKKFEEQHQPEPLKEPVECKSQTALEPAENIKPGTALAIVKSKVTSRKNQQLYALYQQKIAGFKFEAFPVKDKYFGQAAPLNLLSHADARLYRKTFNRSLKTGSNFAGKYTLVSVDCGPACQENYIIQTQTGKVTDKVLGKLGVSFRPDSRLLIVNPPDLTTDYQACPTCGPMVYVLENDLLYKAKFIR